MEIKCPYCGNEEYECFDPCGIDEGAIQKLCVCLDCDKEFSIIYTVGRIEKES